MSCHSVGVDSMDNAKVRRRSDVSLGTMDVPEGETVLAGTSASLRRFLESWSRSR